MASESVPPMNVGAYGGLWSSYVVVHLVLKIKSILQWGTNKSSFKKLCFMAVVPSSHSLIILPKTGRGNGLLGAEKELLTHVIADNHNLENSLSLWNRFCTQTGRLALPLCPLYSLALYHSHGSDFLLKHAGTCEGHKPYCHTKFRQLLIIHPSEAKFVDPY